MEVQVRYSSAYKVLTLFSQNLNHNTVISNLIPSEVYSNSEEKCMEQNIFFLVVFATLQMEYCENFYFYVCSKDQSFLSWICYLKLHQIPSQYFRKPYTLSYLLKQKGTSFKKKNMYDVINNNGSKNNFLLRYTLISIKNMLFTVLNSNLNFCNLDINIKYE